MSYSEFKNSLGIKVHANLDVFHQFKGGPVVGRGALATGGIDVHEELCRVPIAACLGSHELCRAHCLNGCDSAGIAICEKFNDWIDSIRGRVSDFVLLIIRIAFEQSRAGSSPWKFYFDLLPPLERVLEEETNLVLFSELEAELLRGTSVEPLLNQGLFESNFTSNVLPWLKKAQALGFCETLHFTLDSFKYKSWLLISRGFQLGSKPNSDQGYVSCGAKREIKTATYESLKRKRDVTRPIVGYFLVPVVDMLNHAEASQSHTILRYPSDSEELCFRLIAERPIRAKEQVFNNYGTLSNAQLMQSFGFLSQEHTLNDQFVIPCSVVSEALYLFFASDYMPSAESDEISQLLDEHWSQLQGSKLLQFGSRDDGFFLSSQEEPFEPRLLALLVYFLLENDDERYEYLKIVEDSLPGALSNEFWIDFSAELQYILEEVVAQCLKNFSECTLKCEALYNNTKLQDSPRAKLAQSYRRIEQNLIINLYKVFSDGGTPLEDLFFRYFNCEKT